MRVELGMSRIRQFDGVMPKDRRRDISKDPSSYRDLHCQVHVDTYAWLCRLAGEEGIGLLLDDIAKANS
jgi:hypothetical protein